MSPSVAEAFRPTRRSTTSWIIYDLANTIFSFNILSIFYPVWLSKDLGLPDSVFAIGNSVSMAVILLLSPVLGALSDQARRRIPFLIASTVLCVATTIPLGFVGWNASVVFFVLANIGFQGGLIFYDALLAVVSTPQNRGRIGALGVGIGYVGSFVGLALGTFLLSGHETQDALVFAATGLAFLVLSVPAFLWVREPPRPGARVEWAAVAPTAKKSFKGLWALLRGHEFPSLRRFLIGRIFYTDAANTMIAFMGVYAVQEAGFGDAGVRLVLLFGIVGAAALAPLWGILVDRAGAKRTLDLVLLTWMFALLIVALIPVLGLPKEVFFPLAFLLGGSLGGTWSADRPLMLSLAPTERLGEFYGYYSMVGRFSAILGPLAWALIVDGLDWGRPAAVFTLFLFMILAFAILRRLPDPKAGESLLGRYLPWRDEQGNAKPLPARWWTRFPATLTYSAITTGLFAYWLWQYAQVPRDLVEFFVYRIPRLFTNLPLTLLNFLTAEWVNHNTVQLVYVLALLALFGVIFEIREGTPRALLVFYATSILGGILAGLLLHVLHAYSDAAWVQRAWDYPWAGGSAGAFGLMGALAARAKRPWLLLLIFTVWEINVGAWYLKSYTPAFHLSAMAIGFGIVRYGWGTRPGRTGAATAASTK